MAIPTNITGGLGKPVAPDPISKGRYRLGVKKLPEQTAEIVPIFTNGHMGTLESADQIRYGEDLLKLTVPAYAFPEKYKLTRVDKQFNNFEKNAGISTQVQKFQDLVDEFIHGGMTKKQRNKGTTEIHFESKLDLILQPVFETSSKFLGENVNEKTLLDIYNTVKPKVKDGKVLLYTDHSFEWAYWLQDTMEDALDDIQEYITKILYKGWKFDMQLHPYGMAVYHVDSPQGKAEFHLMLDKVPGTRFAFYNHKAHLTSTKDRDMPQEDRYFYAYFAPFVAQTRRLFNYNPDIDYYALCAEIIANAAGYGDTTKPKELPLTMEDIRSEQIRDLFKNVSLAYDFINFENFTYYEIMKWNILRTLCIHRIKIPTMELTLEMDTNNWDKVTTQFKKVTKVQLPSIGSDSSPYMILADNLARVDNNQDDTYAEWGFFLPYSLGDGINLYRKIKDLEHVEAYSTPVLIKKGEVEGNQNDPMNQTAQYYHFIADQDVRAEVVTYYEDRLIQTRIPRLPYTSNIYGQDYSKSLYVLSFLTNASGVYSDGLVVKGLPQLMGNVGYFTRAIAPESYSSGATATFEKRKDGSIDMKSIDTGRLKDAAQPSMNVPKTAVPKTDSTIELQIPEEQKLDARMAAGIPPKADVVKTAGIPSDEEVQKVVKAGTTDKGDSK